MKFIWIPILLIGLTTSAVAQVRYLDLRVFCETDILRNFREAHEFQKNKAAWTAAASKHARGNAKGFRFAPGKRADIRIAGIHNVEKLQGQMFNMVDRRNKPLGRTIAAHVQGGQLVFSDIDLGDGAVGIDLAGHVQFVNSPDFPRVILVPKGWAGVGRTWNGTAFEATFAHRMDNSAIMPESVVAGGC